MLKRGKLDLQSSGWDAGGEEIMESNMIRSLYSMRSGHESAGRYLCTYTSSHLGKNSEMNAIVDLI